MAASETAKYALSIGFMQACAACAFLVGKDNFAAIVFGVAALLNLGLAIYLIRKDKK